MESEHWNDEWRNIEVFAVRYDIYSTILNWRVYTSRYAYTFADKRVHGASGHRYGCRKSIRQFTFGQRVQLNRKRRRNTHEDCRHRRRNHFAFYPGSACVWKKLLGWRRMQMTVGICRRALVWQVNRWCPSSSDRTICSKPSKKYRLFDWTLRSKRVNTNGYSLKRLDSSFRWFYLWMKTKRKSCKTGLPDHGFPFAWQSFIAESRSPGPCNYTAETGIHSFRW